MSGKSRVRNRMVGWSFALPLLILAFGWEAAPVNFLSPFSAHAAETSVNAPVTPAPQRFSFDSVGRLIGDLEKARVECPSQNERTAVLMLTGQSQAGNHGGQRYRSEHATDVVNFFGGQCFVASSPLLGATGTDGEYWTLLANRLVSSRSFDRVILAPVAVGNTAVAQWARGGELNSLLVNTVVALRSHDYHATHILWQQGEADVFAGTSERDYATRFGSVADTLREQGVTAPIYVSVSTKCGNEPSYSNDNAVARAQLSLPDPERNIFGGVNSDALLDELDRFDDCHMGATGQRKVADAWAQIILRNAPR